MPKKILVIDDEKNMRDLIAINFKGKGFDVITAANGDEGLKVFEKEKPDLVLADVVMPDTDGFDICRTIKKNHPFTKVIVYTGNVDAVDASTARMVGADDFVAKTGDLNYLIKSALKLTA